MSKELEKLCFVVTPIGGKDTSIRRHIEGIIDHAIIPALEGRYEVEVAHRKYEIGSINDRIINSIYAADLVIANLTTLNPNVMFELAIRYSFGKPAIVIAEQGTQLPFDIIDENTIFYENDPTGAYVLKEQLIKFESNIVFGDKKYGPIYKALSTAALYKDIESGNEVSNEKMLRYIADKVDALEKGQNRNRRKVDGKCKGVEFEPMMVNDDYENKINSYKTEHPGIILDIRHIDKRTTILFKLRLDNKDADFIIDDFVEYMGIISIRRLSYLDFELPLL